MDCGIGNHGAVRPAANGLECPSSDWKHHSVKTDASGSIAGTLSAGSSVHANETIKTGGSGQAGLDFIDKSTLHVGPDSSVRLDRFVYNPNKGGGAVVIDAAKGALRFSTGAQGKNDVKIKTPHGAIGVRG
jgi:hypothetical protein